MNNNDYYIKLNIYPKKIFEYKKLYQINLIKIPNLNSLT